MASPITFDDALSSNGRRRTAPEPSANSAASTAPITFDDAVLSRAAASLTSVDNERLGKAQQLRDMGLTDPRELSNPDVPIEGFLRHQVPDLAPAPAANFGQAFRTAIIADPGTQTRNTADRLFPGDPAGVRRVGTVDGVQVYADDDGRLRQVSSPSARFAARFLANTPEAIGSFAGSLATGNPISGSALGAAGANAMKRGASALMFGEPVTTGGVAREMASEGAIDVAGGLIGKGASKFLDRGRVVDFSPQNARAAESTVDRVKRSTGIDLDLAQASGNRKLIAIKAYATRFPGRSAELLQAADDIQRGQLDTAVGRVMDSISRAAPAEVYGVSGMNAARLVIETAKANREATARPLFEAARSVSLPPDIDAALRSNSVLAHFVTRAENSPLYQADLKGLGKDTIGRWQAARMELDDAIAKAAAEPNKVRILTQARAELTKQLEAASPEFAKANAAWARMTRDEIEPLEASPIGVLSRITNPKAATAAARIFADPNITAMELRATRASIEKTAPDAWNGLVRQYIASRWNKALRETQTGSDVNAAGKLRQALIGTPEDKAKLSAMLPSGSVQAFEDLMEAVQAMARTPTAGSNTMRDTEIRDQLKGQGAVAWKWLTSFRASLTNAAEQGALNRGTEAIAEAILDPSKRSQLRRVAKMPDGARKAMILAGVLGAQSVKVAARDSGPDALPIAYGMDALQAPRRVTPRLDTDEPFPTITTLKEGGVPTLNALSAPRGSRNALRRD